MVWRGLQWGGEWVQIAGFYGNATLKQESQPCSSSYKMGVYVLLPGGFLIMG